jgi:hypothetical protein
MNLLSREDMDEGGAVFAVLALATFAWAAVYLMADLLRVHWAVALPITWLAFGAIRATISAVVRGMERWWESHDARVAERQERPPPEPWYRSTVEAINAKNRGRQAHRDSGTPPPS